MTVFREDHEQPWQLHHLCLSVRSMFDAMRKYAIEADEQDDQKLNPDTIIGMCEAGYDLADRAWHLSCEVDLNRKQGKSVQPDTPDTDTPDAVNDAAGPQQPPEQIPAPTGEWWEDIKTNACQCLGDAYSLGYDVGRKAGGAQ